MSRGLKFKEFLHRFTEQVDEAGTWHWIKVIGSWSSFCFVPLKRQLSTAVREVIYPDPSCLWLVGIFFIFFFNLLFLFVRILHMLSVLYDLGD